MSAKLLSGTEISAAIRAELKTEVETLAVRDVVPGLGVILVGDDPASRSYVTAKEKCCTDLGMHSVEITLPQTASRNEILAAVEQLNADAAVHGILVQLPLPDSSIEAEVIDAIRPDKDVDGFHPVSAGRMMLGRDTFLPCTPHGVLHMLKRGGIETSGKHVVIIGRSNIVGRPLANMLSLKSDLGNATVTLCHSRTPDPGQHTRQADIVIVAVGRPNTLTPDMVKDGAVVIDVGVNRVEDASRKRGYRLVGDADFDGLLGKASAITPVPGGVGPMTITMLMLNTIESARKRSSRASHT